MSQAPADFRERYTAALRAAIRDGGEGALSDAYELGRRAVGAQLSVLDLAELHHDALLAELAAAAEPEEAQRAARAAGDFFLESLSAFEMLQRVLREAREEARLEQRHAVLLRRLSSFLADASLALDDAASLEEMLQLVGEHALEVVDARACLARLAPTAGREAAIEALAVSDPDQPPPPGVERLADLFAALRPAAGGPLRVTAAAAAAQLDAPLPGGWLAAPLTALDGRDLGLLALVGRERGDFGELDEAVVAQLAQMASAAVERVELYGRRA
jgi:hypothetical protein